MLRVQIVFRLGCLDTDPALFLSRDLCLGTYTGPESLVTCSGNKMLATAGGRELEWLDLLFGFHFGLLYKWLILLLRADPCVCVE